MANSRVLDFYMASPNLSLTLTLVPPGWQILVEEKEEQRGSKALPRRTAAEGEPDHGARLLPGAGERRSAAAGGRAAEGLWPLQEHPGPVRV